MRIAITAIIPNENGTQLNAETAHQLQEAIGCTFVSFNRMITICKSTSAYCDEKLFVFIYSFMVYIQIHLKSSMYHSMISIL